VRIATYNVEWFDHLFDDRGRLFDDDGPSGRQGISRAAQAGALARVMSTLDADALLVVEAPDQSRERDGARALESFARRAGLRARAAVTGFPSETQQEIALLVDPDRLSARHDPRGDGPGEAPRFDGVYHHDIDGDGRPEPVVWARPPLEVALRPRRGAALRLIGVHAKSKAPHGAKSPAEAARIGIENRRKQLAQCLWLRARVDEHLARGEALVVLGDFNDGPGLDQFEALFGRSGVEIVLGDGPGPRLFDPHVGRADVTTAIFRLPPDGRPLAALLDFVMVSPGLRARGPLWRVWHPEDDPACRADQGLAQALRLASDHFPVSLDLEV
jgi:hypothetical protein